MSRVWFVRRGQARVAFDIGKSGGRVRATEGVGQLRATKRPYAYCPPNPEARLTAQCLVRCGMQGATDMPHYFRNSRLKNDEATLDLVAASGPTAASDCGGGAGFAGAPESTSSIASTLDRNCAISGRRRIITSHERENPPSLRLFFIFLRYDEYMTYDTCKPRLFNFIDRKIFLIISHVDPVDPPNTITPNSPS